MMRYRLAICNLAALSGKEWKLCCSVGNVKRCACWLVSRMLPECANVQLFLRSRLHAARAICDSLGKTEKPEHCNQPHHHEGNHAVPLTTTIQDRARGVPKAFS